MSYELVPYHPKFREQVVALRSRAWVSGLEDGGQFFAWKYERNPYLPDPLVHLALSGNEVVAMRCHYGSCWEIGPTRERFVIPSSDDLVVAEEHRKRGLMSLMVRATADDLARRGFEYTISTSAGRVTALALLAMGWKSALPMEPIARFGRRERWRQAARDIMRGKRAVWRFALDSSVDREGPMAPFTRLDRTSRHAAPDGRGTITFESAPRAEAMVDLHRRAGYDGRIRHVRDAAYLAWRYQNPLRDHRFAYHEVDGRLEGYLAFARWRVYQDPMMPFTLTDWECASPRSFEVLLRDALSRSRFGKLGTWAATLTNETRTILTRAGFVPVDQHLRARGLPCLLVRKLTSGNEEWKLGGRRLLDPSSWDIRILQSAHG